MEPIKQTPESAQDNIQQNAQAAAKDMVKSTRRIPSLSKLSMPILAALAVVGIGASIFFFLRYNDVRENPSAVIEDRNAEESARVTGKLQKIIRFTEEDPTVARIEDPSVLQSSNPDFYRDAVAGDYLVLFPSRAIVYRESDNQIINVAPIINTDAISNPTSDSTVEPAAN